ncbi:MAG: helix-turn-helix transcriptional regulator [Bacillota bacterium]|jgi:PadR family transcriptional regulator PadR
MCGRGQGRHFQCPNVKVERFVEPCLLLLLAESRSHGYELIERLGSSGLCAEAPDAGLVYRTLRRLEKLGVVSSEWETGGAGPARRLYCLTAAGEEYLAAWRQQVEQNLRRLQRFLQRHDRLLQLPDNERPQG